MNIIFWILKIILCIKIFATGITHGFRKDQGPMMESRNRMGEKAQSVHILIAIFCFICSMGILLPDIISSSHWIPQMIAAIFGIAMLLSILFHVKYREKPLIIADVILSALAFIVMYGQGNNNLY